MQTIPRTLVWMLLALPLSAVQAAEAPESPPTPPPTVVAVPNPPDVPEPPESEDLEPVFVEHSGNSVVAIGHDASLDNNSHADAVVSILGSATSDGEVAESVVSILGNTRVSGLVGDSAVAILGSNYINGRIGGNAVAVLGDLELGPDAQIGGDVVVVGGSLKRDPQAKVGGNVESVLISSWGGFEGLRTWARECLLYGRPLAFEANLGWAWGIGVAFLALYVAIAALFRRSVDDCVRTALSRPGQSVLAALMSMLLFPVLLLVLVITVIGIVAIPFLGIGLFLAVMFGKVVALAWIGRGLLSLVRRDAAAAAGALSHPALGVLVGGILVLLLYTVPVFGIILYKLLGIIGLGIVVLTVVLAARNARDARRTNGEAAVATVAAAPAATAPASAPAAAIDAAELPRANFWIRMAALAVDALLIAFIVSLIHDSMRVTLLCLAAYGAVMWKLRATTIGGSIFGLKLVRTDDREIDWATAIVRALSCFVSLLALGLGFLWIAFDEERQAWHDKISGTAVVRVPKGVSLL